MHNSPTPLNALKRPGLLIRAARHGLGDYRRERTLPRLVGDPKNMGQGEALDRLIDAEAGVEAERTAGIATYSVTTHVELLIALMAEARLITRQTVA